MISNEAAQQQTGPYACCSLCALPPELCQQLVPVALILKPTCLHRAGAGGNALLNSRQQVADQELNAANSALLGNIQVSAWWGVGRWVAEWVDGYMLCTRTTLASM